MAGPDGLAPRRLVHRALVDRLLFPVNWPSANRIVPELQHLAVGDFVPDCAPETGCGFVVEQLVPG